jgi:D-3-phosphoglycerate dehydrogenase
MCRVLICDKLGTPGLELLRQAGIELDERQGLTAAKELAMLPRGARVINCARGGIINELDLAEALTSRHLAGAALDVFVEEPLPANHPLLNVPNVVLTPHLGASTVEAQEAVCFEAARSMIDFLTRGVVGSAVNRDSITQPNLLAAV